MRGGNLDRRGGGLMGRRISEGEDKSGISGVCIQFLVVVTWRESFRALVILVDHEGINANFCVDPPD